MTTESDYLAIFLGSRTSPQMMAWTALPEAERKAREQRGIAAWKDWAIRHRNAIVSAGGPLGKTRRVSAGGVADVVNAMGAFVVVRAESHEAAASFFENHPHFTIFPGESVEIMPVLPTPGA